MTGLPGGLPARMTTLASRKTFWDFLLVEDGTVGFTDLNNCAPRLFLILAPESSGGYLEAICGLRISQI
jgi:hypothetical protein